MTASEVNAIVTRYQSRNSPKTPTLYGPNGRALAVSNQYESGAVGRRSRGWTTSTTGPNVATLSGLRTIRDRSRDAYRNDPYLGGAIDHRVEQLVGGGIWPKSLAKDEKFRETVQALFLRFSKECDVTGRHDFGGFTALGVHEWQEGGEVFVRKRFRLASDGLAVPLQLQMLEPEFCPIDKTETIGSARIRAGIEFNADLRDTPTAYHFYREHPADGEWTNTTMVRVRADDVIHMFLPLRAGQLRGVPHLYRVLMTARDLDIGDDATLRRWGLANMLMASLKRGPSVPTPGVDPITGQPIVTDTNGLPMVGMESGAVVELFDGEELEFNQPPEAGNTYEAFMRQQLRKIATGARVPYHALTGDMNQVNDRTIRVILQDFRRSLEALQWQVIIHQFCQPIWEAFFERAVLSGALKVPASFFSDPEPWMAVEWAPDRWGSVHPTQDIEADEMSVRAGFTARTLVVKARGEDVEYVDRLREEDNRRDRQRGLVSTSDASATDTSGKRVETPSAAPAEDTEDTAGTEAS